jgi:hypothetical protein
VGDTYGPIGLAQSPSAQSSGIERPKHSPTSPSPLTGLRQFWPLALIWAYVDVPAGAMPSPCSGSPPGEIEVAVRTDSYSVTATTPGAGSGRHGAMKPAGRAREGKDWGERGIRRSVRKRSMRGGHSAVDVGLDGLKFFVGRTINPLSSHRHSSHEFEGLSREGIAGFFLWCQIVFRPKAPGDLRCEISAISVCDGLMR